MTSQDIKRIKKVAFTLIKFGSYALDALVVVETFSGLKRGLPGLTKKLTRNTKKFKVPRKLR